MNSERGSAIIMLFIAVSLFGALAYAFIKGSNTSTSLMTDEQAKAYAQQILAYSNDIRNTTQRLKIRGCKETNLSFENNAVPGYTNTNSPPDTCKIYHVNGGGVTWKDPETEWLDTTLSSKDMYGHPVIVAKNNVKSVGVDNVVELVFFIPYIRRDLCLKINDILNIPNPGGEPPDIGNNINVGTSHLFTGSYIASVWSIGENGTSSVMQGKQNGCVYESAGCDGGTCYHYYQVLLAR